MIFRIRLPRLDDLLGGLDSDSDPRSDLKRQNKLPKNHECSCLCSVLDMEATWNFILEPIIITFP